MTCDPVLGGRGLFSEAVIDWGEQGKGKTCTVGCRVSSDMSWPLATRAALYL